MALQPNRRLAKAKAKKISWISIGTVSLVTPFSRYSLLFAF